MEGSDCSASYVPGPISAGDNAWILASSALVLLMTPGLGMFYGGLVGAKNVLNTVLMSYACGCIVVVQWIIVGYTFAFGSGNGAFGSFQKVGLNGVNNGPNVALSATLPEMTFVVFQMTFAMITPALMSGSIACRLKFRTWLVFLLIWTTIVYDLVAHWLWAAWVTGYTIQNGVCTPQMEFGWLRAMGAIDFAGGAVVHITSGVSALTACILIGPRRGDLEENKPHNVPLMMIGAALLWFGWFGFNGGSAITSSDGIAALAIMNSNIAAGVAFCTWVILDGLFNKRISVVGAFTGSIVGLATVTPACGYVRPLSSLAIGFIGAVCAYFGIKVKERLKYDDTLDVFACHGIGGILGILLTGLFSETAMNPAAPNGAFFGNPMLLALQLLTVAVVAGTSIVLTLGILVPLKFIPGFGLTPSEDKEVLGMDYSAHREVSYRMDSKADLGDGNPWGMPTTPAPTQKPAGLRMPPKSNGTDKDLEHAAGVEMRALDSEVRDVESHTVASAEKSEKNSEENDVQN